MTDEERHWITVQITQLGGMDAAIQKINAVAKGNWWFEAGTKFNAGKARARFDDTNDAFTAKLSLF